MSNRVAKREFGVLAHLSVTWGEAMLAIFSVLGAPSVTRGAAILAILRAISDHPWSIGRLVVTISCRFVEH